jgi:hypothetical protein
METKTEQRHEHLTEEEKKIAAQMRFVAATLCERVDLDKPTVEFLREHFYKDPTLALAYFYCCSTDPCMAIFNDELQPEVDGSEMKKTNHNIHYPENSPTNSCGQMDTDDEAAGRLRSTDLHRIIVAALEGHEKKSIHYHALRKNYTSLMCASYMANHPYEN